MGIEDYRFNRRTLLMSSASITALAALAPSSLLAATPASAAAAADIRYIVTDGRYPQSLEHAKTLTAQNSQTLDINDGLTRLWQEHLHPLWQQGEGAVAGVTTRAVWQCLAEQARSHALRTRELTPLGDNDGHPDNLVSWTIA
jgi:hypothetical protein